MIRSAVLFAALLACAVEGRAAVLLYNGCPPGMNCSGGTGDQTFTTSDSSSTVTQTNNVSQTINRYATELRAYLPGGPLLFDQILAFPFSDGAVQAGVGQAEALLTGAGAKSFSAPTLISSNTALSGTSAATASSTTSTQYVATLVTLGAALLQVGDLGSCQGFDTTNDMPVGCSPAAGTEWLVHYGTINVDVDTHTFYTVSVTNTTTNTYTTSQIYDIVGSPAAAPEPGSFALIAGAVLLVGLGKRLGLMSRSGPPHGRACLGMARTKLE